MMPNRDSRDGNFCLYRTPMIDTFSCIPFIYLFHVIKCIVCNFFHYASQIDRFVQIARAYCCNRLLHQIKICKRT